MAVAAGGPIFVRTVGELAKALGAPPPEDPDLDIDEARRRHGAAVLGVLLPVRGRARPAAPPDDDAWEDEDVVPPPVRDRESAPEPPRAPAPLPAEPEAPVPTGFEDSLALARRALWTLERSFDHADGERMRQVRRMLAEAARFACRPLA